MSAKEANKHEVEVLHFDVDEGFVYHCVRCGKCANNEAGAWILKREVCIGKKSVQ